jgi:aspartate aminotransferase
MAAPKDVVQACEKMQGQFTSGANSITQRAGITALRGDLTATYNMTASFKERRDFVIGALRSMPGIKINMPDGAFYAFPNISSFFGKTDGTTIINNDEDFAMYLLHSAHICTVNGAAFGDSDCIRISYATSMPQLEEAMKRLRIALERLR